MITSKIRLKAQLLWDYLKLNQLPEKSDCIIVFGCHDPRVAQKAAELYLNDYTKLVVFTGGNKQINPENRPEAEMLSSIAISRGLPEEAILIEKESTNTGENISFTKKLLKEHNINPNKIIAVQRPYIERRLYATLLKQWPEASITVTSSELTYSDYFNDYYTEERVISILVGEIERLIEYPKIDLIIGDKIPDPVLEAHNNLLPFVKAHGLPKFLIKPYG